MTSTKRTDTAARGRRPTTAREIGRALRPSPADRIVRWIGVGRRRATIPAEPVRIPDEDAGNVVALTWVQTFGRAARWALAEGERGQALLRPTFPST